MPFCAVINCRSSSRKGGLHFHRFPKNKELSSVWLNFCQQDASRINLKNATICSKHFKKEDYQQENILKAEFYHLNSIKQKVKLKIGSVPTLSSPIVENKVKM